MDDCIARGDKFSHSGCVRWPTHLQIAALGCAVVAVVLEREFDCDPFVRTLGAHVALLHGNPNVTDEMLDALWPRFGGERIAYAEVLAAVTPGTCGAALWDEDRGEAWRCERSDLTPDGEHIVATLERLYGRPAVLVTFLDT